MRLVPISLISAFTTEITVRANGSMRVDQSPTLDISDLRCEHVTLQPSEKQPHWRVQLMIMQDATPANNAPYSFRIVMEGGFVLTPDFPADQAERFVTINGTSILYGLAREQLRSAMSSGPFVSIMLPSVTFAPASPVVSRNS